MAKYEEMLLTEKNKVPLQFRVRVSNRVINRLEEGIGMAFDIGGLKGTDSEKCFPPLEDKNKWEVLLDNLSYLKPGWMRLRIPGKLIMPSKGKIDKEAEVLSRLEHFHNCAKKNDIDIVIGLYPTPVWLAFKNAKSSSLAPSNLEVYVKDYIYPILDYLLNQKGYSQIKYFYCFDEPFNEDGGDFTFWSGDTNPYIHYVEMYRILRKHLDKKGIKIKLFGPTSHDLYPQFLEKFERMGLKFPDYVDGFDTHVYRYRFDYLPPVHHVPTTTLAEAINEYVEPTARYARGKRKHYFFTEFACMYYGKSNYGDNRGPGRHEALIHEAELITRSLNAGVNGFLRWAYLFNPRRTHGYYQMINSFNGSYDKQDSYYFYANLCRYIHKDMDILKTSVNYKGMDYQYLHVVVLKNKSGELTILLVNDHPAEIFEVKISFGSSGKRKKFHKWVTDFKDKYEEKKDLIREGNYLKTRVTPLSITVLSTLSG